MAKEHLTEAGVLGRKWGKRNITGWREEGKWDR